MSTIAYRHYPTSRDERLYRTDKGIRADIPVSISRVWEGEPSIAACRYAVLELARGKAPGGRRILARYVVYDRFLARVVNGVFYSRDMALGVAKHYNADEDAWQDMAPTGNALKLIYPEPSRNGAKPSPAA